MWALHECASEKHVITVHVCYTLFLIHCSPQHTLLTDFCVPLGTVRTMRRCMSSTGCWGRSLADCTSRDKAHTMANTKHLSMSDLNDSSLQNHIFLRSNVRGVYPHKDKEHVQDLSASVLLHILSEFEII